MKLMAIAGALVMLLYALIPICAGSQQSSLEDVDTFGDPWTLPKLVAELREAGVSVDLEPAGTVEELFPDLPGSGFSATGTISGFTSFVLVYPSPSRRAVVWREQGGPEVFAKGYGRIPEVHAWGAQNAVVFIYALSGPGYGASFKEVRAAILALRR